MFKTLFISIWLIFHPVHVTLTSINYVPENECFKVFVRIYFDDFMLDLNQNGKEIQNIDFSDNNSSKMDVMQKYLSDKILIKVNEELLSGKLLDIKMADNEISMNLEYNTEKKPKTITVKNLIMTDLYSDQANMVIVKINDFEEGVKLTSYLTEQTFKIK